MRRKRQVIRLSSLFLAAVLLLGMLPVGSLAATSKEIQKELDALEEKNKAIQSEINAIRSQYDANFDDMSSIVEQKGVIDQEIGLLSTKIENTNQQIAAHSQLIADTQDQLEAAQTELDELSNAHRERIRVMEEHGNLTYWQVIFEANSFMDLLDRLTMMQEISEADRKRIEQMRIVSDIVIATRMNLESEKTELETVRQSLEADQVTLEEKRQESDKLLYELEKKSEEFEILLAQSEELQDGLMQEIAKKEKELSNAKYNEELARLAMQGQNPPSNATWVCPVSDYRLSSPFGMRKHPVLGYSRMHNGIDMAAASGTPIYATRAGTVTTASYQAGGAGNYVSINHGDGFASIYMHMTNYVVSKGQTVSQGPVIGYVGSTGLSTGPHLHFGISYAGTYVNPLAYIY